jgi:rhomboid protease GluP
MDARAGRNIHRDLGVRLTGNGLAMSAHDRRPSDFIEILVSMGRTLGLDATRLRWRLLRWQKSWQDMRVRTRRGLDHASYEHAVCPECGQVQDRKERRCVKCGASLGRRTWQIFRRIGLQVPTAVSVSTLLGMLILVSYLRLMLSQPGTGYFTVSSDELIYLGAYFLPAIRAGQIWRHATAMFLHIGLLHLIFNMVALAQIGPVIEDTFGRARMLFLFLFTGIVGFVACQAVGMMAVSAGASGAIMGLTGAAAGWGQRDGTGVGRGVRNLMLKWAAYTMIFGMFVHANNVAHAAGFASGAVMGYFMPPRWLRRGASRGYDGVVGLVAVVALALTVFLVMRPPASSEAWAKAYAGAVRAWHAHPSPQPPSDHERGLLR